MLGGLCAIPRAKSPRAAGVANSVVTAFLADNVLRPILIGGAEELTTLIAFLGVFGGVSAFGLLGIFIGPVTLAIGLNILDVMRRQAEGKEAAAVA